MRYLAFAALFAGCAGPCDEYAAAYCRMYADCLGLSDDIIPRCERDFRKQLNAGFNGRQTEAGCNTDFLNKTTCAKFRQMLVDFCTDGKFERTVCWTP